MSSDTEELEKSGSGRPGGDEESEQELDLSISLREAASLAEEWLGEKIAHTVRMDGYDDLNFHILTSADPGHSGYTLKILNSRESQEPLLVEAHNALLHTLSAAGINVPVPVENTEGREWTVLPARLSSAGPGGNVVRMLKFLPGKLLSTAPLNAPLLRQLGETTAKISQCLQDFDHVGLSGHDSPWFLHNAPLMLRHVQLLKRRQDRQLVTQVLDTFDRQVLPLFSSLPQGVIHGDLNEQNVLVRHCDNEWRICGVLDVGDSHHSALLADLAVAAAYMWIFAADGQGSEADDKVNGADDGEGGVADNEVGAASDEGGVASDEIGVAGGKVGVANDNEGVVERQRVEAVGHVLAGYWKVRPIPQSELELLQVCVAARIAQSLLGGVYAHHCHPDNAYVLSTAKQGWPALRHIWKQPRQQLIDRWRSFC